MRTLYVRNVDDKTLVALEQEAKERNISVAELARQILNSYVTVAEVNNINDKYRAFTEDLLRLYRYDQTEMKQMIERCIDLADRNEELYQRLSHRFDLL